MKRDFDISDTLAAVRQAAIALHLLAQSRMEPENDPNEIAWIVSRIRILDRLERDLEREYTRTA